MLHATPKDFDKIEAAVCTVVQSALSANAKFAFVNLNEFYESCALQSLRKTKFPEEVSDLLTGTEFCSVYGIWLFTEFGDGMYVFVDVSGSLSAKESIDDRIQQMVDEGVAITFVGK